MTADQTQYGVVRPLAADWPPHAEHAGPDEMAVPRQPNLSSQDAPSPALARLDRYHAFDTTTVDPTLDPSMWGEEQPSASERAHTTEETSPWEQPPTAVCSRQEQTAVLRALDDSPPPVFVDETGRRKRRLRLWLYAAILLCLSYATLVGLSLAGGAAGPDALLPFPDLVDRPRTVHPTPPKPALPPSTTTVSSADDAETTPRRRPERVPPAMTVVSPSAATSASNGAAPRSPKPPVVSVPPNGNTRPRVTEAPTVPEGTPDAPPTNAPPATTGPDLRPDDGS